MKEKYGYEASDFYGFDFHHLDDFHIENGIMKCSMQVVNESVHGAIGMTHSGSPKLYELRTGIPYK